MEREKRSKQYSRNKGVLFERKIAKMLSDWWGDTFSRTPLSGGWQKKREEGKRVRGDIITPDNFPFLGVKDSGLGTQGVRWSIEAMIYQR